MSRLTIIFLVLAVILAAHAYIIENDLYNKIWWLDIVLHILGGMWAAWLYVEIFRQPALLKVVLFVLFVGLIWEILEFVFDTPLLGVGEGDLSDPIWLLDTILDLITDVAAAALFWRGRRVYNKGDA